MSGLAPVAIDVFRCPLAGTNLVEASAGTGKTWTLSALYLRCVLELGQRVPEILVVTYTNAATAELRERIRARLAETLLVLDGMPAGGDPFVQGLLAALGVGGSRAWPAPTTEGGGEEREVLRNRLRLALAEFDQASIFTIHGFCQRALAETPIAGGVPLVVELVPDDADLLRRAVADAWRATIGRPGALSVELARHLVEHPLTPGTVVPLLRRRLAKPLAREIWPEEAPAAADASRFRAEFAALAAHWPVWREEAQALLLGQIGELNNNSYKPDSVAAAFAAWDAWLARPTAAPPSEDKLDLATASTLAAKTKKNRRTPQHPLFAAADAALAAWREHAAELDGEWRALLRRLLDDAQARLHAEKRRRRLAGYDDLLRNLHTALDADAGRGARLAAELQRRFPVALIDEFQDTDPVQWAIFSRLWTAGRGVLFLVGDPKQAIYRFRHADVDTYLDARAHCTTHYTLSDNQRSAPALIDAVNTVFSRRPDAFMHHGLAFHPASHGRKPRPAWQATGEDAAALRVWLLPRTATGWLGEADAKAAALAACANEIARLIAAGAAGAVRIGDAGLLPRDIAVLVRTHGQARQMRAALAAVGVGSVELSPASVFASREADEMATLLAAVAEPQDARRVRAALATELLGHTAASIAALADAGDADLAGHVERFAGYRDIARQHGFAPFWRTLLDDEGVVPRLLALADGERRLTNLLHLAELVQAQAQRLGVGDALQRWFAEQRADSAGGGDEAALRLESDRDLVQIVTVHKAKGLEYPVVFCPLLWVGAAAQRNGPIAGVEYHDGETAVVDFRADAEVADQAKRAAKRDTAEEELRLIYVALTRAVYRCYMVAGIFTRKASTRAAGKRNLNWLIAAGSCTPEDWLEKGPRLDEAAIEATWRGLAGQHISVEPLPLAPPSPITLRRPAPATLAVRPWTRQLGESWRIGSFSGLMHHAAPTAEAVVADRDELVDLPDAGAGPLPSAPAAVSVGADDIRRFPRGATAGECLHAIFEHAEFGDPGTWPAAIAAALRRFPLGDAGVGGGSADNGSAPGRLATMAGNMLRDVTACELVAGLRLADVPPARRLSELAFSFPTAVGTSRLVPALRELGYHVPSLAPTTLNGYLSGFIDLVFESSGRYFVLDWKSNHLGDAPADYAPGAVAAAMSEHGYHLQALIYAVAVHRYLAQRLPGYDYATHFGGILYLFIRGVRPGAAWQDDSGRPCGVYAHRPSPEDLAVIEALLTR